MKIALCISGQPRNVQKGYSQFIQPNFLAHNECDVFIHTWLSDGFSSQGTLCSKPAEINANIYSQFLLWLTD